MIVPMHKAWNFTLRKPERLYSVETSSYSVATEHRWPIWAVTKAQASQVYLNEDNLSCLHVRLVEHDRDGTNHRILVDNERACHFERGYIAGCIPAGSNVGMLGVLLAEKHREPVDVWLQRLRNETNQSRQARNKPLLDVTV